MFGADVGVAKSTGFPLRQLQDLLHLRRERDVPQRRVLTLADDLPHLVLHCGQADPRRLQGLGRDALAPPISPSNDQSQQEVLGRDVIVVQLLGFDLRQHQNPARPVGKPLSTAPSSANSPHAQLKDAFRLVRAGKAVDNGSHTGTGFLWHPGKKRIAA